MGAVDSVSALLRYFPGTPLFPICSYVAPLEHPYLFSCVLTSFLLSFVLRFAATAPLGHSFQRRVSLRFRFRPIHRRVENPARLADPLPSILSLAGSPPASCKAVISIGCDCRSAFAL